jgi:hypothetical protein
MINNKSRHPDGFIPASQQVQTGQPYWVQCTQFTCRAAIGKEGHWKEISTGKELPDVINVFATH